MTGGKGDEGPSLLGSYPVPALRLVGSPEPSRRVRARWWPPTPQYGIDYSFAHRAGRTPVRWAPDAPITVRLTGYTPPAAPGPGPGREEDPVPAGSLGGLLAAVTAELAELTGLDLRLGEPFAALLDLRALPEQEVHVAFLMPAHARRVCRDRAVAAGQPGSLDGQSFPNAEARCGPDGRWYRHGWAIVNTEMVARHGARVLDSQPAPLMARILLRHQLCHVLGLGHVARPSLLMHQRIPLSLDGYGLGERHGLARIGAVREPRDRFPLSSLAGDRTLTCD